jgi:Reverse transcriptase (RNA-dependent DNA polymerase)
MKVFDIGNVIHEGQNGFRVKRNCVEHILTLSQLLLGRKRQGKRTYSFFLDIKKAYDTVWRNGLWYKLWQLGIRGKAWRIIKNMYDNTRSCVSIDGKLGEFFDMNNGVAQGDTLSPTLFSLFINDILKEIEAAHVGVEVKDKSVGALMFADDFVGMCDSGDELQSMINMIYTYASKYRFEANVSKCAVVVFGDMEDVHETWYWGDQQIPLNDRYVYLGVTLHRSCSWEAHVAGKVNEGKTKLKSLRHLFLNRSLSTQVKRTILQMVLKPALTYGGEVWEPTSQLADQLDGIIAEACRDILCCGSRTSHEPMFGDLGILPLKFERIVQKLMFHRHVHMLPDTRLPKIITSASWRGNRRGRQTQMWSKIVGDLCTKYVPDIVPLIPQMSVDAYRQHVKDVMIAHASLDWELNMRGKEHLHMYLQMNEGMDVKPYILGPLSTGQKVMFRMRSGNVALNGVRAKLDANVNPSCPYCDCPCEDVTHVVVSCPAYDGDRDALLCALKDVVDANTLDAFLAKSDDMKTMCLLSPKQWDVCYRDEVTKLMVDFLGKLWQTRKRKADQSSTLPSQDSMSSQLGSASAGGAEVYGHMTTTPNL